MPERQPLLPSDEARLAVLRPGRTAATRGQCKRFLTSKTGHYSILLLVTLDISCIFADLLLTILTCEGRVPEKNGSEVQTVLSNISLAFSCLFMLELLASIWAFGWHYFHDWFHCLDATVITAGLLIDILLRGVGEEVGSLVVVLRLWRVFKIIEELSAGAADQMAPLRTRIEDLEDENERVKLQLEDLKAIQSPNGQLPSNA